MQGIKNKSYQKHPRKGFIKGSSKNNLPVTPSAAKTPVGKPKGSSKNLLNPNPSTSTINSEKREPSRGTSANKK